MKTENDQYTREEQEEFRPLVQAKLDEARADLKLLVTALAEMPNDTKGDDFASDQLSREETQQLAGRQRKFIEHLEAAMKRIDNGVYGSCRVTAQKISKERLRLVPHAGLSIEARKEIAPKA